MEENEVVQQVPTEEVPSEPVQEETPAVETTESVEEPHVETPPEPRKKTAQERIDEITRLRREAEREKEYWKKVALEKEKEQPRPQVESPRFPPRPTLDQFETTIAYEDALFEWRDKVKELESASKKAETTKEEALREFNQRADKLRKEHEDFDEVVERPPLTDVARIVIAKSENGPALAYYLGNNISEAERIAKLPLEIQPYELGKLETKILLAQKTRKVSNAPNPISPVGISGGAKEKDPSEMSIEEWMAWDRRRTEEKLKKKYGG